MSKSVIPLYYWLTPLFWLLDLAFGWNVRAAAFDGEPVLKTLYYLLCTGCGAAIWLWPGSTRVIALAEASVNITLLLLRIVVPYFRLIDQLAAGEPVVTGMNLGGFHFLALLLSAFIWAISFQLTVRELGRSYRE